MCHLMKTDSINIGELTLLNQVVGAIDLTGLANNQNNGDAFGGILGYDFLSRFPVLVDYKNKELTVYNPADVSLPEGGIHIPFNLTMQIPTITAEIEGVEGEFIIDLGNAFGLILFKPFVENHRLMESFTEVSHSTRLIGGVGGTVAGYMARGKTFTLGQIVIEEPEVLVPEISGGITASEDIAGNIGNMVLEEFSVLFDYQKNEIILFPN